MARTYTATIDVNLCVGGPYAGRPLQVTPGVDRIDVPPRSYDPAIDGPPQITTDPLPHPSQRQTFAYRRHTLAGHQTRFEVWAPESWTGDEIMSELLAGYREAGIVVDADRK